MSGGEDRTAATPALGNSAVLLPRSSWSAPLVAVTTGVMAFLAVLLLIAALAANSVADEWRADLSGVATVRVSAIDGDIEDRVKSVLEVLRTTPGIARVRLLDLEEQYALLEPWLGNNSNAEVLPMPRLIDVTLLGDGPDPANLQARLDLTVDGVVYDDHATWRAPLARAADGLERLALGASALALLTVALITAFAARVTLIAHRDVVETLRLVGAEDGFIARAFVGRLVGRAAIGGAIGAILAAGLILLLPQVPTDDPALTVSLMPSTLQWAILMIGVPAFIVGTTWIAARGAIRYTLRSLL